MKFLIGIGIEKCGTTSLFELLRGMPEFNMSTKKETFFFNKYYIDNKESYFKLFNQHPLSFDGYSVDITPSYFRAEETLKRIYTFDITCKIIINLREPVKRAYSHYVHDVVNHISHGQRSNSHNKMINVSFEHFFENNKERYFPSYSTLVKNAFELFGKDNVFIIDFDYMIKHWAHVAKDLSDFLGFQESIFINKILPHTNRVKKIPRIIRDWKNKDGTYNAVLQTNLNLKMYSELTAAQLHNALELERAYSLQVPTGFIDTISDFYKPDIDELKLVTSQTFDLWKKPLQLSSELCEPTPILNLNSFIYEKLSMTNSNRQNFLSLSRIKQKLNGLKWHIEAKLDKDKRRRTKKSQAKHMKLVNANDHSVNGQWPNTLVDQPWFDQIDALEIIENSDKSESEKEFLTGWVNNGYVIADVMDDALCDALVDEMVNDVWGSTKRYPGVKVFGLRRHNEEKHKIMLQTDLAKLPAAERQWMRVRNSWRIHGLDAFSNNFEKAAEHPEVIRIGSLLYNEPAVSGFTLSFGVGSQQPLHQDYAQFHIYPRNYLIGCWIALEDIHTDSGPLEYYPGSHKLGLWHKHDVNYPQLNLRTTGEKERKEYLEWLKVESKKISERKELIIRKGQALFWHACLSHGGSKRLNSSKTRHSLVLHLVPEGKDVDKRLIINKPV